MNDRICNSVPTGPEFPLDIDPIEFAVRNHIPTVQRHMTVCIQAGIGFVSKGNIFAESGGKCCRVAEEKK